MREIDHPWNTSASNLAPVTTWDALYTRYNEWWYMGKYVRQAFDREFGWGGTPIKSYQRCSTRRS